MGASASIRNASNASPLESGETPPHHRHTTPDTLCHPQVNIYMYVCLIGAVFIMCKALRSNSYFTDLILTILGSRDVLVHFKSNENRERVQGATMHAGITYCDFLYWHSSPLQYTRVPCNSRISVFNSIHIISKICCLFKSYQKYIFKIYC